MFMCTYDDIFTDRAANETISEFIRARIREQVKDPEVAELLAPKDHPYGTKRPTLGDTYYQAFNRPNVTLVDVKSTPIQEISSRGVVVDGHEYECDVLVVAIGFDALTGAYLKLNATGRDGLALRDLWQDGPHTYLGMTVHGFPNFFMITGPQSAAPDYNNPLMIEDDVEFASDTIRYCVDNGITAIEPSADSQKWWNQHVLDLADQTLLDEGNSWWIGANIPGKPRVCMYYAGGAPRYRRYFMKERDNEYGGFDLTRAPR